MKLIVEYLQINKDNAFLESIFKCNIPNLRQELLVLNKHLSTTRLVDSCKTLRELFQDTIEYGICSQLMFGSELIWASTLSTSEKYIISYFITKYNETNI